MIKNKMIFLTLVSLSVPAHASSVTLPCEKVMEGIAIAHRDVPAETTDLIIHESSKEADRELEARISSDVVPSKAKVSERALKNAKSDDEIEYRKNLAILGILTNGWRRTVPLQNAEVNLKAIAGVKTSDVMAFLKPMSDVALAEQDQGNTILKEQELVDTYTKYSKLARTGYLDLLKTYSDLLEKKIANASDFIKTSPVAGDENTIKAALAIYFYKRGSSLEEARNVANVLDQCILDPKTGLDLGSRTPSKQ